MRINSPEAGAEWKAVRLGRIAHAVVTAWHLGDLKPNAVDVDHIMISYGKNVPVFRSI